MSAARRIAVPLVLLACLVAAGFALWPRAAAGTSASRAAFSLPSLVNSNGGASVTLSTYRGKPVVVDLFASWCSACSAELPLMAAASHRLQGKVTFIGVDSQDTGDGLGMAKRLGIGSWPLASDIGGAQSDYHEALEVQSMPVTAFYNANGSLLGVDGFALTQAELDAKLQQYFGIAVPK